MLFLGSIGSFYCSALINSSGSIDIVGPKEGFYGYKLDSASGDNGIFVKWKSDDTSLILQNDSYGMYPVYYSSSSKELHFSSNIECLVRNEEDCQLDDEAIAVFLRAEWYIGNSTPFLNIKALPPGALLRFDKNGCQISSSPMTVGKAGQVTTRDQAIERYGELFHNSMNKFLVNISNIKVGVPLSGGRDSRHILFDMVASGCTPHSCLTMKKQPPRADEDARIAKEVCDFLNIKHILLNQDSSFLDSELSKNRLTNFCALSHSWLLPLSRFLRDEGYEAIFDGIGGDMLSSGLELTRERLSLYRSEKYSQLANNILGNEALIANLLTEPAYRRFNRDLAIRAVITELEKHVHAPNPVGQMLFWNRTRRYIALAPWGILNQQLYSFAPYLDHELYSFLTSLPAEYFLDHSFHEQTISQKYPQYAHIPYEAKSPPIKYERASVNYPQIYELLRYFIREFTNYPMYRPIFIYPRLVKSLLTTKYYNRSNHLYRIPIYLDQLRRCGRKPE